jgi:hypothetical protein
MAAPWLWPGAPNPMTGLFSIAANASANGALF